MVLTAGFMLRGCLTLVMSIRAGAPPVHSQTQLRRAFKTGAAYFVHLQQGQGHSTLIAGHAMTGDKHVDHARPGRES